MTNKNAQTVTQSSNRSKPNDAREKKTVFKAVLDNPHRIHWPSVPLNLQEDILATVLRLLQSTAEYQLQRFSEIRKRKRREKDSKAKKRQKLEPDESETNAPDRVVESRSVTAHSESDSAPVLLRHLVYGINGVTRRLENQIRVGRRPVITTVPEQPFEELVPALSYVFVCRSDMNPPSILDHIPHLVSAYNTSRHPDSYVILVPLPKGAEESLAQALGIRRVSVFGIESLYPVDSELKSLLEKIPILTASWLSHADTSHALIPTHVKQLRTTAPKDMKAAKELRREERAQAKQRRKSKRDKNPITE